MKNLFAIFGLVLLCLPTHANAYSDDSNKCFSLNQGCKYEVGEKKFKYVKGQKFLNQATRSTQVLAIVGGNNDSKKRLAKAKKLKEKINSFYVIQDQRGGDLNQNYQLAQETSKKKSNIRTQGNYVGFDVILNKISFYQRYTLPDEGIFQENDVKPTSHGYGFGANLNYKYAFNYKKWFFAPGIFYERLKSDAYPTREAYSARSVGFGGINIRDRYGVFANLGYDVNHIFSPYVVVGYSAVKYNTRNGIAAFKIAESRIDTAKSMLYGLGTRLKYNDSVAFNLEFNTQRFHAKQVSIYHDVRVPNGFFSRYVVRLSSLKVGMDYKF